MTLLGGPDGPGGPASAAHVTGEGQEASAGQLVKQLSELLSRLVRDEMRLATTEMTSKAKTAGKGAGLFGGSSIMALYGAGCLIACVIIALAGVVPAWLAALIVGVALLAAAGAAALAGRSELKKATPPIPVEAAESVKADVEQIKESAHR